MTCPRDSPSPRSRAILHQSCNAECPPEVTTSPRLPHNKRPLSSCAAQMLSGPKGRQPVAGGVSPRKEAFGMPEPRRGERRPRRSASSSAALPGLGFVGRSRSGGLRPRLITAAPAELIGLRPENVLRLRLIPHRCAQTEPGQPGGSEERELWRSSPLRPETRFRAPSPCRASPLRYSPFAFRYRLWPVQHDQPPPPES